MMHGEKLIVDLFAAQRDALHVELSKDLIAPAPPNLLRQWAIEEIINKGGHLGQD